MSDLNDILVNGIKFHGIPKPRTEAKVKTKAKKKSYITGQHNSASAKMKADIRRRRANRPSQRKGQGGK